ncbi:unnamed protein product [Linum trigynum]|uniref:Uncharacterized protein n=1 Tax=Linum trigynum TaxID=586398 RepID=A0AAV2E888_9ROSI
MEVSATNVGGIMQGIVGSHPGSAITVTNLGILPENAHGEADKGWLGPSNLSVVVERELMQDHGLAASQTLFPKPGRTHWALRPHRSGQRPGASNRRTAEGFCHARDRGRSW